ncbi:MAG: HEPN domain-containing protein [Bacteroidetes bacterium]|nr:HEPN domain-containing protein [Bacteroidota bacterium]MCW5896722.1 HEPN domain-containing protein [Bacteroidota bacterium]
MARSKSRIPVDRARSLDYRKVAQNFFDGAALAREFEYWNAAGVLIMHAAIAWSDAIAIKIGGVKSRGADHHDTIALLDELIVVDENSKKAMQHLRRIIDHKNAVSYSGEIYERGDIEQLWKLITRFREWSLEVLE